MYFGTGSKPALASWSDQNSTLPEGVSKLSARPVSTVIGCGAPMITPSFFSASQLWPDFSMRYDRYSSMSLKGMLAPMPSFSASCLAIHQAGFWSCGAATTGWRNDVQPVRP